MAGRDITEPIVERLGSGLMAGSIYANSTLAYDIAIGGQPFFLSASENYPYRRETASYRRQQIDQTREPGEQSLEGWWFRSQSSFHLGAGIKFLEPLQGDTVVYRFNDSQGVDPWTPGKVSLLKNTEYQHTITSDAARLRSIQVGSRDAVLLHDGYDVDQIFATPVTAVITYKQLTSNVATLTTSAAHQFVVGSQVTVSGVDATFNGSHQVTAVTSTTFSFALVAANVSLTAVSPNGTASSNFIHWLDYNTGTAQPVYAICDDGTTAYWLTNTTVAGTPKMHLYSRALSSTGADTTLFNDTITISTACMEWVKGRMVAGINNKIYQLTPSSTSLPAPIYTHPNSSYVWTSITDSGAAIYVAGYAGTMSAIVKFTLNASGGLPTLSDGAVVAATMPRGEIIHSIYYYLGYMAIGTNKGVRIAQVSDTDGSIVYGPLLFKTTNPVKQFAGRDKFLWATANVGDYAGCYRIDLGTQIDTLVFPYASDSYNAETANGVPQAVTFVGTTDRLAWASSNGDKSGCYFESATTLMESGWLDTGQARFNTLEPKHFKFVKPRCAAPLAGGFSVSSIDRTGAITPLLDFVEGTTADVDVSVTNGTGQESMGFRFTLKRGTDTAAGSELYGYQMKVLPALRRARMLMIPVLMFDWEIDRYNVQVGYEGRAWERILALESLESTGDVVSVQDFTSGEFLQGVIEKVSFDRTTPPSKKFDGFGGVAYVQVRTVA